MPRFIIRVGFHYTRDKTNYERVKNEMKNDGFQSRIEKDGKLFELPIGEYMIEGDLTISQVIDKAKQVASIISKDFGLVVSEIKDIEFYNLLSTFPLKK